MSLQGQPLTPAWPLAPVGTRGQSLALPTPCPQPVQAAAITGTLWTVKIAPKPTATQVPLCQAKAPAWTLTDQIPGQGDRAAKSPGKVGRKP